MPKIVLSYRRSDSASIAGRIFDGLTTRYGSQSVFMDIDSIPYGADFRRQIAAALKASDAMLVIIGPKWIGPAGEGQPRIKEDVDPVRVELETALQLRIPVMPVLVDGAAMPIPAQLPDNLKDFAYANAAEVDSGRDFHHDVDRLISGIDKLTEGSDTAANPFAFASGPQSVPVREQSTQNPTHRALPPNRTRKWRWIGYAAVALIIAALVGVIASRESLLAQIEIYKSKSSVPVN